MLTESEIKIISELQAIQKGIALCTTLIINELKEIKNQLNSLTQAEIISIAKNIR